MPQNQNGREAIRNLQIYLRQIAYFEPGMTMPPVDGVFGSDTRKALEEFQKQEGLPATGIADQEVWELLYAAYRSSLARNTSPLRMDIFPNYPPNMEYCMGSKGFVIMAIQFILQELERHFGKLGTYKMTGEYDEKTANAVREFQKQNALQVNGQVGCVTWNKLVDQYNTLFAQFPKE